MEIPGYKVQEKIGEGGSSDVYRAVRLENNQNVALKILHTKYCTDVSMRKRLIREARVVSSLAHPNIVKIYKFGTIEDRFYIILEHLSGGSLGKYSELNRRERLGVVLQVCDAVDYVHQQGIVHRDLKPSNIMFGGDQIPRLVDFGISLFTQENFTRLTHTNMVMGTLSYMSPEQQSDPGSVDERSDIYSLGAIMYEIFTTKRPVGRFENPSVMIPEFPKDLETCILRCLEHKKENRYKNVDQMREALLTLWNNKLFDRGDKPENEGFDTRIGYWIKQVETGTLSQRLEAPKKILAKVQAEDIARLIEICESSEFEVRNALIPALGRLKNSDAVPFLLSQVGDLHVAQAACTALAEIGDKRALAPILKVVKARNVYSHHALVPLANISGDKFLKTILPYLKMSLTDRMAAVKAFEIGASKRFLRDLLKAHKAEKDSDLKNRLYILTQRLEVSG